VTEDYSAGHAISAIPRGMRSFGLHPSSRMIELAKRRIEGSIIRFSVLVPIEETNVILLEQTHLWNVFAVFVA
jgi:hypothetical protein